MLSEDEKKAIKILGTLEFRQKTKNYNKIDLEDVGATNIVLNLITRLEKENKNSINKDIIRDKINERQFELQQEYKDFKDDIRLNTLQELYYYESKEE